MFAVKNEEFLCHGCLSEERKLSPLTNYDLYLTLLGNKKSPGELKYVNIELCWECSALLRGTEAFRHRLQLAQCSLELAHEQQISTNTLSTLTFSHKQYYDCCIEETIESKPDIDNGISIDNGDIDIKRELDNFETDDSDNYDDISIDNEDIDIKKESVNFERDNINNYDDNYKEDKLIKRVGVKEKKEKPKTHKKQKERKLMQKIDNELDLKDPDKYFSQLCLSEMEIEEILERERDGDTVDRPHKCGSCGFRFASKTELYHHKRNYHRRRKTTGKCQHCAYPYSTPWELELHSWRSHPVHRCRLCGRVLARDRDRARHLQTHRFKYRCVNCLADFDNRQLFLLHEKQLHSRYTCDHCGQFKATRSSIEKHIVRHHLPNKCPSCPLVFQTWERLSRHSREFHSRGEQAYCVECDATFATRAKYARHLSQSQRHRPRVKISVPCPECGKVFSRKNYMNNHMKLFHSNQSRHHCQICDKYFVTAFSLRYHNKRVHEKIPVPKTKICSVCGRGFGTNRVLENHMRTHTGERPFACARCSAAFAQRVALKAHLAAVHKEK